MHRVEYCLEIDTKASINYWLPFDENTFVIYENIEFLKKLLFLKRSRLTFEDRGHSILFKNLTHEQIKELVGLIEIIDKKVKYCLIGSNPKIIKRSKTIIKEDFLKYFKHC